MLGNILAHIFLLILHFSSGEALTPDIDTQSLSSLSYPHSYPSCFSEGVTWSDHEAVNIIPSPSLYTCQDYCFQDLYCHKFTWFDSNSSSLAFTCFMYKFPTTELPCSNCVSGPQSCDRCDIPEPQRHGDWFCLPHSLNPSTCHLECDPGYASNNGTVLTCEDGAWTTSPICEPAVALITGSWNEPQTTVEVYSSGFHRLLPELPDDRDSHSLDLVDSSILLCGGATFTGDSCLMLTSSLQWVHHSTLPSDREDHSSVSALGQLHLLGGGYPSTWPTSDYLPRSSTNWTSGWELLEDTWAACAAKVEPELVVVTGGYDYSSSVISYNVTSGGATRLQNLISPRYNHGCCYIRNQGVRGVLVAGGGGGQSYSSHLYDFSTGEWSTAGLLHHSHAEGVRLFVIGDQILASGGYTAKSTVDRFNITSRTWEAAENMIEDRAYHAVVAVHPSTVGIGSD